MSIESTTSILVQNSRAQNERNLPCPSRSFISCSSSACFPSMKFFRIWVYKQVYCCKERNPRRCNRIPRAPNQRWHYVGKRNSVFSINHPPCLWLAHFQAHSIGPDLHSGLVHCWKKGVAVIKWMALIRIGVNRLPSLVPLRYLRSSKEGTREPHPSWRCVSSCHVQIWKDRVELFDSSSA